MRKLIYYVACTVDRFIARTDGSFDFFLQDGEHFADLIASYPETFPAPARLGLGINAPNKLFDTVLMGRETYDVGANIGLTNPYPQLTQYVFSRTMRKQPDEHIQLVSEEVHTVVKQLKHQSGKHIWLCGGSLLAAELFDLIDEVILKINPILLGTGKPLVGGIVKEAKVDLIDSKTYPNSFMLAHYQLKH